MFSVGLVEAVSIANVCVNGAGIVLIDQPLVETLQRKLAGTVARRAVFVGIGVLRFAAHSALPCLIFVGLVGQLFHCHHEVRHLDGDSRRIRTFVGHACLGLLIIVGRQHRIGDRNAEIQTNARDAAA